MNNSINFKNIISSHFIIHNTLHNVLDIYPTSVEILQYLELSNFIGTYTAVFKTQEEADVIVGMAGVYGFPVGYIVGDVETIEAASYYDCIIVSDDDSISKVKRFLSYPWGSILYSTQNKFLTTTSETNQTEELKTLYEIKDYRLAEMIGLTDSSQEILESISPEDAKEYAEKEMFIPQSILNTYYHIRYPMKSKNLLLILTHIL